MERRFDVENNLSAFVAEPQYFYRRAPSQRALFCMAPNRFTGQMINLWGSRVLCSPTDAKQKRAGTSNPISFNTRWREVKLRCSKGLLERHIKGSPCMFGRGFLFGVNVVLAIKLGFCIWIFLVLSYAFFEFLYKSSAYMADTSGPLWPLRHVASSVKLPGNLKIQAPCARRLHRCFRGYDWSRNLRTVPAGKVSFRRLDLLRLSNLSGQLEFCVGWRSRSI